MQVRDRRYSFSDSSIPRPCKHSSFRPICARALCYALSLGVAGSIAADKIAIVSLTQLAAPVSQEAWLRFRLSS